MAQSTHRLADASQKILVEIARRTQQRQAPVLIVLDGGSGAGKSTVAAMVGQKIHAVVVPLDDFFAAHIPDWQWKALSIAERAKHVFDWQRLRNDALEPLLANRSATWYPFDFRRCRRLLPNVPNCWRCCSRWHPKPGPVWKR